MEKKKKEGKGKPKEQVFPGPEKEKITGSRFLDGGKEKDNLPPFPGADQKDFSPLNGNETDLSSIEEICRDLVSIPFEVWSLIRPGVPPLTEGEKKLIGKPLARVFVKYDVAKFLKDEFLLIAALGFSVMKRIRVKPDVKDDSREAGEGKDNLS